MTHVTCRLTAKNRDQFRNPTLGSRVWATFTFADDSSENENIAVKDMPEETSHADVTVDNITTDVPRKGKDVTQYAILLMQHRERELSSSLVRFFSARMY